MGIKLSAPKISAPKISKPKFIQDAQNYAADHAPFKLDKDEETGKSSMGGPAGKTLNTLSNKAADIDPTSRSKAEMEAEHEAKRLQEEAAGLYDDLTIAESAEEYAMPETLKYSSEGLDPALLTGDYTTADSKFGDIAIDPRFQESQMAALSGVEDIVNSDGLTATDQANLARIESGVGRADRGRREAIQDRMRRQGMSGSGLDLLAQLQSGQAATDRQSQAGLDVAAMGQQRKDSALQNLGSMSTNMRGQAFGEEAQKASAQDSINRFNAQAGFNKDSFNTNTTNDASRFNIGRQDTQDQTNWGARTSTTRQNTDLRNQNRRDQFNDDLTVRNSKSNAKLGLGNYRQGEASRMAGGRNQMIQGGMQAGATLLPYAMSDEDEKEETSSLSPADIEQFLESVKPKKYKYKDPANGAGDRVGFMAQDIEDNPIGDAIVQEDGEGTKRIDNFNLMGALLDGLSHLHKKQKKMEGKS